MNLVASLQCEIAKDFTPLDDLGTIVVPDDYHHRTRLCLFAEAHGEEFDYYCPDLTDEKFSNPSHVLRPGERFNVRAFKSTVERTSAETRMAFLDHLGSVYLGAQGLSLVVDQKRDQLSRRYWYTSYDEEDRLWKDTYGHLVPSVRMRPANKFDFTTCRFEGLWPSINAFLSFTKME